MKRINGFCELFEKPILKLESRSQARGLVAPVSSSYESRGLNQYMSKTPFSPKMKASTALYGACHGADISSPEPQAAQVPKHKPYKPTPSNP